MRLETNKNFLKALLASSVLLASQVQAFDITTDTTIPITLDSKSPTYANLNIKASGGSLTVAGQPAITLTPTGGLGGLASVITIENSTTKLPADVSSNQQALLMQVGGVSTTLTLNMLPGSSMQATGTVGVIESTGTLTGTVIFTLNNSGTISNTGTGVNSRVMMLDKQITAPFTINNNVGGVMLAGPYATEAINLNGGTPSTTSVALGTIITNAGSIIAPGGKAILATINPIISFTNSGYISGVGTVLDFTTTNTTVNLTGGSIVADAPTSTAISTSGGVNITGGSIVGAIVGAGSANNIVTVNVGAGNVFSTGGNIVAFNAVNVNSGTFNLLNNMTLSGGIRIASGAGISTSTNVSVFGPIFTNVNSILSFDLSSNNVYGQITTGAGTSIGGTQIVITNNGNGYIANNTTFTVLNAPAMTVTSTPTFTFPVSAVYGFSQALSTNTLNVTVTRTPFNAFGSTGAAARLIRGVGNALEILAQSTTNASLLQAIGELGRLPTAAQVEDALKLLIPNVNYMSTTAVTQASNDAMNKMRDRMRMASLDDEGNLGYSAGNTEQGESIWAEAFGSRAVQHNRKGIYGYSVYTKGLIMGSDLNVTDAMRLGGSVAYSTTKSRTRRAARNDITVNAYQLGLYGAQTFGCGWVEAAVTYARLGYKGIRRIQFGAINARATNDHHGTEWALTAGYGHHFVSHSGLNIEPSLAANWIHVVENPYQERGAAGLNLQVDSHTVVEVDATAMLKLSKSYQSVLGEFMPEVDFGIKYELWDEPEKVSATFLQTGPTFRVVGLRDTRWTGIGGVGVTLMSSDALSFKASYEANIKRYYVLHSGALNVRYVF